MHLGALGLAILAGLGVDACVARQSDSAWRRGTMLAVAAGLVAVRWASGNPVRFFAAVVAAVTVVATLPQPRVRVGAAWIVVLLVVMERFARPPGGLMMPEHNDAAFFAPPRRSRRARVREPERAAAGLPRHAAPRRDRRRGELARGPEPEPRGLVRRDRRSGRRLARVGGRGGGRGERHPRHAVPRHRRGSRAHATPGPARARRPLLARLAPLGRRGGAGDPARRLSLPGRRGRPRRARRA